MLPYFNHLFNLDGSVPFSTTPGYGDILDSTSNLKALVKAYPANLWQEDPAVINLKALGETNAISASAATPVKDTPSKNRTLRIVSTR
jgi:hypothetical protein